MRKYSKYTKEQIEEAVSESFTLSDSMRFLGLVPRGSNYQRFKQMVAHFNISTNHFKKLGTTKPKYTRESFIEEVLIKTDKPMKSYKLKIKLLDFKLIEEKCNSCGIMPKWNGKLLRLQLDHIDGDYTNNILENLQMLCPNCHSQTDTYCGKNKQKRREKGEKVKII